MDPLFRITRPESGKAAIAETILRDLPDWFGIETATAAYISAAETMPMLVARSAEGAVGFASLERTTAAAVDIHVIGVLGAWHRRGIGHALVEAAAAQAQSEGARLLTVKTLSSRHGDPFYARTRRFYEAAGFLPVAELPEHWGPDNPCLLMAMPLGEG